MIFKFINLDLERTIDNFSNEEGYAFFLKSRAICDFLERYIYALKIQVEKYHQLGIRGYKETSLPPYINSNSVLFVASKVDMNKYRSLVKSNHI